MPLSDSASELRSTYLPILSSLGLGTSPLRSLFELPPPPSHFPIPPSAPRRDAAIAAAAAQVVKAENVLLGNYLESLGREASRDRGYLSWDRRRDAASAPPPVKPFPNDYTLVSQKLGVGSYANEMSS